MSEHVKSCRVCGIVTACKVQGSNFYKTEGYEYFKGVKARFDNCCPECKDIYSSNIKRYASLKVLISYFQFTRAEWELRGCE